MAVIGHNTLPPSLAESFAAPQELDFDEFAIWIDDIAELREEYHKPTDRLTVRDANPGGIGNSIRYKLAIGEGDRFIYFYEPQSHKNDERPDLVVRNFSSNIVLSSDVPLWQVRFFVDEERADASSNEPVDYLEISALLEEAVAKAHLSLEEGKEDQSGPARVGFAKYKQ